MKTELDKCMAGEWYDCHDPIFITQKGKTRQLLARYNALPYEEKKTKQEVLKEMFGSIGNNVLRAYVIMVVIFISATMYLSI